MDIKEQMVQKATKVLQKVKLTDAEKVANGTHVWFTIKKRPLTKVLRRVEDIA